MNLKALTKKILSCLLLFLPLLAPLPALAQGAEYPELNYDNVMHALYRLDKFKPEDDEQYMEGYAMAAQCDVVKGSYRDEFRWKQAKEAIKKWLHMEKKKFSTRLAVKSRIMFDRYDFATKTFLFSESTQIRELNIFTTDPRTDGGEECNRPTVGLMPNSFRVVTNNPLTLPGLQLTEAQAQDLAQKFTYQNNKYRIAYIRFVVEILDGDYLGPSMLAQAPKTGGDVWAVKGTLKAIEFYSDPEYRNRFYLYNPV